MRGYAADRVGLGRRLKRVEGQVRGVATMVEDERYCIDIITQIRAAKAALAAVETELLKAHIGHCLGSAVAAANSDDMQAKLDELLALLPRIAHS